MQNRGRAAPSPPTCAAQSKPPLYRRGKPGRPCACSRFTTFSIGMVSPMVTKEAHPPSRPFSPGEGGAPRQPA